MFRYIAHVTKLKYVPHRQHRHVVKPGKTDEISPGLAPLPWDAIAQFLAKNFDLARAPPRLQDGSAKDPNRIFLRILECMHM